MNETSVSVSESVDSASEKALIAEFKTLVETPEYLRDAFELMQEERAYIAEGVMAAKDQNAVTVNQVLKNQQTVIAHLGLEDPQATCSPMPQVGGQIDPAIANMAETCELFLNHTIKQTRLAELLEGAVQDAQTNGIAWLRVALQEDFFKDPVGQNRFNDQQENVAEFQRLQEAFDAKKFTDDSADYQRMVDLQNTLKVWMAEKVAAQPPLVPLQSVDPMTGAIVMQMVPDASDPRTERKQAIINGTSIDVLGCPELERYLGFSVDQIIPEDVRYDWSVTRPEDIRRGAWMAYRMYFSQEDICGKFALSQEDCGKVQVYSSDRKKVDRRFGFYGPDERQNIETAQINDRCAVWTLENRILGRRYCWVDGLSKFLVNEAFQAVGANPFSLFPIYFNRVTGRSLPLSDTALQRDLQDEYNLLRTHDREGRRASYPYSIVAAGAADKEDLEALRNREPFQAVMLKKADDINKYFKDINGAPYNPGLYDTSRVTTDMQAVANVPLTGQGVQGEGRVATDLTLANAGMQKANSRRLMSVNRTFTDIMEWIAQVAVKVFPAENIKAICGPNAMWMALSAEQLTVNFQIDIKASVNGPPDFASKMQFYTALPDILMKLMNVPGLNVPVVMQELMRMGGITTDLRNIWTPGQPPMGMPPMGPPAGQSPEAQGPQGAQGGAPPMTAPPQASNLPNNPNTRLGEK
jgi:hypothetical protein